MRSFFPFSSTLFTSTSDFVYIEGLGYQVNRHLAHAELCVRQMSTPIEVYGKDAFSFREQSIVVTIPFERLHNPQIKLGNKTGNNSPLNERRRQIFSEMRNNPNITTAQLMMLLRCAETTVENHIAYLRKNGYIERIGSRKAGWWKVKNSEDEA